MQKLLTLTEGKRSFDSDYWKRAKPQLKLESGGKCAYCEAPTETVAHGDVEHFRPKSAYWWLAYCYDNYLFACQICNQTYKGNAFPIAGSAYPPPTLPAETAEDAEIERIVADFAPDPLVEAEWTAFHAQLKAEQAHLPNPYLDDPEGLFAWQADPVLKEVRLCAREDDVLSARAVEAAERYFGLNREELRRWRWRTYELIETYKKVIAAEQIGIELKAEVRQRLQQMASAEREFTGMCRYFLHEVWQIIL